MSKVAIITGATGNLGSAVTSVMVEAGFTVVGTTEPGKGDNPSSTGVSYKEVDLTNPTAAKELITETKSEHGSVDAVICLVGGFGMASVAETQQEDLKKMITLNFHTAFNTVQPALTVMQEQNSMGNIVLVGAKPALEASAGAAVFPYALSKAMVIKMAELINADVESHNATATVVVPSIIDTPPNRKSMPDANFEDWVTPRSIAEKIAFVCSEAGKDLRGTVLKIYGNS